MALWQLMLSYLLLILVSMTSEFFCGHRETVYHCYLECTRLTQLFDMLSRVFLKCGENFTQSKFIQGAGYSQKQKMKWQIINFLVGQAKLAILITRRNKIDNVQGQEILIVFKAFVKSRVTIDFKYYKAIKLKLLLNSDVMGMLSVMWWKESCVLI